MRWQLWLPLASPRRAARGSQPQAAVKQLPAAPTQCTTSPTHLQKLRHLEQCSQREWPQLVWVRRPKKVELVPPTEGVTHPFTADLISPVTFAGGPFPEDPCAEREEHGVDL